MPFTSPPNSDQASPYKLSTVDGSIFLLELSPPFERLEFQFMPPEWNWDRIPKTVQVPIVGRNHAKKQLTGGEDSLIFTLDFNSLYEHDKQLCMKKLAWLQSLTYNDSYEAPVRNVKLAWGTVDMFRNKIWYVSYVKGRASQFHSEFGYAPQQLAVDIKLELDPEENLRINQIRI